MRQIPLHYRRGYALVEDADYDRVMQYRWYKVQEGDRYVARAFVNLRHGCDSISLHLFVMGVWDDRCVRPKDGDSLNCCLSNLSTVSRSTIAAGRRPRSDKKCGGYKGVTFRADKGKWQARFRAGGREQSLGYFATEREAARAYDRAAFEYYGPAARLNFPEGAKPYRSVVPERSLAGKPIRKGPAEVWRKDKPLRG